MTQSSGPVVATVPDAARHGAAAQFPFAPFEPAIGLFEFAPSRAVIPPEATRAALKPQL